MENEKSSTPEKISPSFFKTLKIGLLIGLLLNVTGWLGNNFILGELWDQVGETVPESPWLANIWREILSLLPDFIYGYAIAWLCVAFDKRGGNTFLNSIKIGILISIVGGITTYFAIANSGFIPWNLAFASFLLVLATKIPFSILAGILLSRKPKEKTETAPEPVTESGSGE